MKTSKKKVTFWVLFAVLLTLYLNAGWAFETYFDNYIANVRPENLETFWQKALGGGWSIFAGERIGVDSSQLAEKTIRIVLMLVWPITLVLILLTWLAWAIWYLLWLIFAGGIAKLFGLV